MTMKLTSREKKTAVVGGIVAVLVVLFACVVAPLARTWSWKGAQLEPKLRQIAELRERARLQDSLARQRNVLVSRLGALTCPEEAVMQERADTATVGSGESAVQEHPSEAMPGSGESTADGERGNPEGSGKEPSPAKQETDAEAAVADTAVATPESNPQTDNAATGVCLATHLERIAKTSGVKIKQISPKSGSRSGKSNKHFNAVALKITIESNIESLIKLLHAIEKGERLVRVEQIRLRRDLKKGSVATTIDVVGYEAAAG
jgi:hypothetical protein